MALQHEFDVSKQVPLGPESTTVAGEVIRDYTPVAGVKWRFGTPNYTKVNKAYLAGRSKVHPEGSLEAVVTKIVKNWEVESHHIQDPGQWQTMDVSVFKASLNGGPSIDAAKMAEIGPYNMLLGDIEGYSASKNTFVSANTTFSNVFPDGFAFEVLEVTSPPPVVSFRWRHFGKFSGTFVDDSEMAFQGDGRMVEVTGFCIAKVNDKLQITDLQVYYDPKTQIAPLRSKAAARCGLCPFFNGGAEAAYESESE